MVMRNPVGFGQVIWIAEGAYERTYKIVTTVKELIKYIGYEKEHPTIVIDPHFQRDYVWSEAQQNIFFENTLKSNEIDTIKVAVYRWNGKTLIVVYDGRQRSETLLQWKRGKIALSPSLLRTFGVKTRKKMTIEELPEDITKNILNTFVTIDYIEPVDMDNMTDNDWWKWNKYVIDKFVLLNKGGKRLSNWDIFLSRTGKYGDRIRKLYNEAMKEKPVDFRKDYILRFDIVGFGEEISEYVEKYGKVPNFNPDINRITKTGFQLFDEKFAMDRMKLYEEYPELAEVHYKKLRKTVLSAIRKYKIMLGGKRLNYLINKILYNKETNKGRAPAVSEVMYLLLTQYPENLITQKMSSEENVKRLIKLIDEIRYDNTRITVGESTAAISDIFANHASNSTRVRKRYEIIYKRVFKEIFGDIETRKNLYKKVHSSSTVREQLEPGMELHTHPAYSTGDGPMEFYGVMSYYHHNLALHGARAEMVLQNLIKRGEAKKIEINYENFL